MANLGFTRASDIAKIIPHLGIDLAKNDAYYIHNHKQIIPSFIKKMNIAKIEDSIEVNRQSEDQFNSFIHKSVKNLQPPSFFVNAFNNIEITWRNADKEVVDLQFLGDGQVQFVIFSKRFNAAMTRVSGRESETRIEAMIAFYGLEDLVYAPSN